MKGRADRLARQAGTGRPGDTEYPVPNGGRLRNPLISMRHPPARVSFVQDLTSRIRPNPATVEIPGLAGSEVLLSINATSSPPSASWPLNWAFALIGCGTATFKSMVQSLGTE